MKSSECEGWARMNRQIRKMLDEQSRWLRIYQFLKDHPPPFRRLAELTYQAFDKGQRTR